MTLGSPAVISSLMNSALYVVPVDVALFALSIASRWQDQRRSVRASPSTPASVRWRYSRRSLSCGRPARPRRKSLASTRSGY